MSSSSVRISLAGYQDKILNNAYRCCPINTGSAIALGPSTAPLLKQLGIYEEFKAISKPAAHVHVVTDNDEPVYNMDVSWLEEA